MSSDPSSAKTAALGIPILPHTAPEAEQPASMKLPLRPHQLRALHRCLLIEQADDLNQELGEDDRYKYTSRGGCLADAVGVGKTATMIALTLCGLEGNGGDTLVVAPEHFLPQWEAEIHKFTDDSMDVIVGKTEFLRKCQSQAPPGRRRIVLIDVDTILQEDRLWYKFRRVFRDDQESAQVRVPDAQMQIYRQAADFCAKSPKGGCSYHGYVYTGPLHVSQRPWRRIILDEIQDLVADGKESSKNLLQLSRTATNVWLLSATPFPHGNASVHANLELLGVRRIPMNVETSEPLPSYHPFEQIKRKLYIRSPQHVDDKAVKKKTVEKKPSLELASTTLDNKGLDKLFLKNRIWRVQKLEEDKDFFNNLGATHHPEYMYIGCADARVPPNLIMGEEAGNVFVQRNVANMVVDTDTNLHSALQYAVGYLKVKDIIVCGHYECGGIKAAAARDDHGAPLETWLRNARNVYRLHRDELDAIDDPNARHRRFVELNAVEQACNIFKASVVQQQRIESADEGEVWPRVHALVFDPNTGLLERIPVNFDDYMNDWGEIYKLYP